MKSVETVKEGVILNLSSQTEFRANELAEYVEEKKVDTSLLARNPFIVSALGKTFGKGVIPAQQFLEGRVQ